MICFGPSGNDEAFYSAGYKATEQAPKWLLELGLNAFEYSFGRGVRIGADKAAKIKESFKNSNIRLSVHAPYFINLAVDDEDRIQKNIGYFTESCNTATLMGASRVIFHPGAVTKMSREEALFKAKILLKTISAQCFETFNGNLCAETMGKINQLGTLEEVIELCKIDERILPTIDFGHLYARSLGKANGTQEMISILDTLENGIGFDRTSNMHIHFSHIAFTAGGEKCHLTLDDSSFGPDWEPLAEQLYKRNYSCVVICESKGTMALDAARMQKIYLSMENK